MRTTVSVVSCIPTCVVGYELSHRPHKSSGLQFFLYTAADTCMSVVSIDVFSLKRRWLSCCHCCCCHCCCWLLQVLLNPVQEEVSELEGVFK